MAKNPRGTIQIFEGRKGGGSRRAGKVRSFRRTGKFTASFEPEQEWSVTIDSRDLTAIVGTSIYGHLKRSIQADQDPETGKAHPKTLSTKKGRNGRRTTRDRDVDTAEMASLLRRSITDYKWRPADWGGGWRKISRDRTRMTFYFASKKYNALNKADSTRRGRNRIIWLGVGGDTGRLIRPAIAKWAQRALEGREFDRDSKQKARESI